MIVYIWHSATGACLLSASVTTIHTTPPSLLVSHGDIFPLIQFIAEYDTAIYVGPFPYSPSVDRWYTHQNDRAFYQKGYSSWLRKHRPHK